MVSTILRWAGLELAEIAPVKRVGGGLDGGQRALELVRDDGHQVEHMGFGLLVPGFQGVADDVLDLVGRERLGDVVEGPVLEGLAGRLDVGIAGEDDDRSSRAAPRAGS